MKKINEKCSVCRRSKVFWSIYLTKEGKMQCTECANSMRHPKIILAEIPSRDEL